MCWAKGAGRSEVFTEPMTEPADQAVRLRRLGAPRPGLLGLGMERVIQKSGAGGEGRARGRLGQAGDADRAAHADLLVEHQGGELAHAGELAEIGRASCRERVCQYV